MSEPATSVTRDEAGHVVARVPLRDGRPHGLAEAFDAAGRRVRTAPFTAGALDGELVEAAADGSLLRFTFAAGVLNGPASVERAGRTLVTMHFKEGALDGPFALYDAASGRAVYRATYAAGLLDGVATTFGPDGAKQRESGYRAGLLDGEVVDYAPDGSVTARTRYRAGAPAATDADDGTGNDDGEPWFRRWARRPDAGR